MFHIFYAAWNSSATWNEDLLKQILKSLLPFQFDKHLLRHYYVATIILDCEEYDRVPVKKLKNKQKKKII